MKKAGCIRLLVLAAFLVGAAILQRRLDLLQHFSAERIDDTIAAVRAWTARLGILGPAVFTAAGSLAVLANAPTAMINYLAVILFGYVAGAIVSFLVVAGGTSLVYVAAQYLGRPFVQSLCGTRLARIEGRFLRRGLANVAYARLIFFMMPAMNWLLSVSGVGFRTLLLGTLLGTAHTVILNVWFGGLVVDLLHSGGSLNPLKTPLMLLPVAIGGMIFVALRVIERRRKC